MSDLMSLKRLCFLNILHKGFSIIINTTTHRTCNKTTTEWRNWRKAIKPKRDSKLAGRANYSYVLLLLHLQLQRASRLSFLHLFFALLGLHCLTTARCFIYKSGQKTKAHSRVHSWRQHCASGQRPSFLLSSLLPPTAPCHSPRALHTHTHTTDNYAFTYKRSKCLFLYTAPTFVYV